MTPGTYLQRRRMAAGLAITDVAAVLATEPHLAEHARGEWIELIETDIMPASFNTIVALRRAYSFDLAVLMELAAIALDVAITPPRLCSGCGCSDFNACMGHAGPCHWVDDALCSTCVTRDPVAIVADAATERGVAA